MAQLMARKLRPWRLPSWWDQNIAEAGAIWELQSQRIRFNAVRRMGGLRPICIHAAGSPERPLAQCLAMRHGDGWAIEQMILVGHAGVSWGEAMQAVLDHLGAGSYLYGHNWSLEPSRAEEIAALRGVLIEKVQPITVHAIENALWPSDDAWLRDISTNVKRNVKRASEAQPPIVTRWRDGRGTLRNLAGFVDMHVATMRRLGAAPAKTAEMARRGLAWLAGPAGLRVGVASAGRVPLATLAGYAVGPNFYYTMGGSVADNKGASWTLLTQAVLAWRRAQPEGRFVLGYLDDSLEGVQREGLLRQRQSIRKSDFATALVRFDYRA